MRAVFVALAFIATFSPVAAQPAGSDARPASERVITRTSETTRTINHDWSKDLGAVISSLAWPAAIVASMWLFISNLEKIGRAFRGVPFVRRFAFGGFEIELDREQLNELKRDTERTFADLIAKTNGELAAFEEALHVQDILQAAAKAIIKKKFGNNPVPPKSNLRFTIHVPDIIFKDFLYQLTGYVILPGSKATAGEGAGRRFSKRYGLIGLSWRTLTSRGVGEAFHGNTQQVRELIERWSMNDAEAERARKKPSCLALIAHDTRFNKPRGIVYMDGETTNVFGTDKEADIFAVECEQLPEVKAIGDILLELQSFSSQLKLEFDLAVLPDKETRRA